MSDDLDLDALELAASNAADSFTLVRSEDLFELIALARRTQEAEANLAAQVDATTAAGRRWGEVEVERDAALARCAALESDLEWYGDANTYGGDCEWAGVDCPQRLRRDRGERARLALARSVPVPQEPKP